MSAAKEAGMVRVKDLQDVVDDLKDQASKRAADLLGEGKTEVRHAFGGHSDASLLGMLGLGIVLGAIVGAALALLFTPFSGDETRRKISAQVEKVRTTEPAMTNGSPRPAAVGSTPYVAS
ncbi:MAG TPA: YtxH domain-containing protein [Candidatus Limnocylindria bacterium]|nr:YtxH domain-containing protein [Candidatus Limnocylindria bacterium]